MIPSLRFMSAAGDKYLPPRCVPTGGLNRRDTHHIQDRINEINALGAVTLSTVVDSANVAENKVVGLEPIAPST